MTAVLPIPFRFVAADKAMLPLVGRAEREVLANYEDGKVYWMVPVEDRSWTSHRHQFAWIKEAFDQLPEHYAAQFMGPQHLRRYALIQCGYHTRTVFPFETEEAALAFMTWVRPRDSYSVVVRTGVVVTILEAESQSAKSMGKERFQLSKSDILEYIANLIGVTPETLKRNAGKAA